MIERKIWLTLAAVFAVGGVIQLPWAPSRSRSCTPSAASVSLMMRQALLYAMPMPFAAALSEPVSRTPKHRFAMPRPNTEPLSDEGFSMLRRMPGFKALRSAIGYLPIRSWAVVPSDGLATADQETLRLPARCFQAHCRLYP